MMIPNVASVEVDTSCIGSSSSLSFFHEFSNELREPSMKQSDKESYLDLTIKPNPKEFYGKKTNLKTYILINSTSDVIFLVPRLNKNDIIFSSPSKEQSDLGSISWREMHVTNQYESKGDNNKNKLKTCFSQTLRKFCSSEKNPTRISCDDENTIIKIKIKNLKTCEASNILHSKNETNKNLSSKDWFQQRTSKFHKRISKICKNDNKTVHGKKSIKTTALLNATTKIVKLLKNKTSKLMNMVCCNADKINNSIDKKKITVDLEEIKSRNLGGLNLKEKCVNKDDVLCCASYGKGKDFLKLIIANKKIFSSYYNGTISYVVFYNINKSLDNKIINSTSYRKNLYQNYRKNECEEFHTQYVTQNLNKISKQSYSKILILKNNLELMVFNTMYFIYYKNITNYFPTCLFSKQRNLKLNKIENFKSENLPMFPWLRDCRIFYMFHVRSTSKLESMGKSSSNTNHELFKVLDI